MRKKAFSWYDVFNVQSWTSFTIMLIVESLIFLAIFGFNGWTLMGAMDGTFVAGCIGVGIAGLTYAANDGTFDVFPVGFANMIGSFKKEVEKRYDGVYQYREIKAAKRKSRRFIPLFYLAAGLIYLIAAFIMFTYFKVFIA